MPTAPHPVEPATLRSWVAQSQGLIGPKSGTASTCLNQCGWARSIGGANPYLTIWSRTGLSRQAIDDIIANQEIHELPAARGCTYVVPANDYGLALTLAQPGAEVPINQAIKYLGVTENELEVLSNAVLNALESSPMTPAQLKKRLGDQVRSLGEEGKKRGSSTTLPMCLGRLQAWGKIRRIPNNGRLDSESYAYAKWSNQPTLYPRQEDAHIALANRFWTWIGIASIKEFQWFSGLGVAATKAAISNLPLVHIDSDRLALQDQASKIEAYQTPTEPNVRFLTALDSLLLLRREVKSLIDPQDQDHPWAGEKTTTTLGPSDAHNHVIVDRGQIIGIWEYDPFAEEIVWVSFRKLSPKQEEAFMNELENCQEFIKTDLGDVRSFSLDSPESRKPRLAALRSLKKS